MIDASAESNRINLIMDSVPSKPEKTTNKKQKTNDDSIHADPTVSVMMLKKIAGKSNNRKAKKGK